MIEYSIKTCFLVLMILSISRLEDLKVLRRSPDLLNNVKKRSRSSTAYNGTKFVLPYMGVAAIVAKSPKQSNEYSSKQPSDF